MNVLDRPNNTKTNCYITCGGVWSEEFPFSVIVLWLKYFIFYYSSCCEPLTFSLCVWEGEKDRARENESHWLQMDWKVLWPSDKSELSQKKKRRHHCSLAVTTVIHCSFYLPGVSFFSSVLEVSVTTVLTFLILGRSHLLDLQLPNPSVRPRRRQKESSLKEHWRVCGAGQNDSFRRRKNLRVWPWNLISTRAQSLWPYSHSNPRVELSLGFCCAVIG